MTDKTEKFRDAIDLAEVRTGALPWGASYLAAAALVAVATAICEQARPYLSPVNMVMAYLLAVVIAALFLGRNQAILSALLGALAFDFFFVPPRFSFRVYDEEYIITFLALFTVGVVISTLVARARERLIDLRLREVQTAALYNLSRSLAAAPGTAAILAAVIKNIEEGLGSETVLFMLNDGSVAVAAQSEGMAVGSAQVEVADWCFRSRRMAGSGTESHAGDMLTYIPLKALADTVGVVAIRLPSAEALESPQVRRLLDGVATQIAMALERARLMQEAQEAQILKARDNLERALLNSISHDLRTPLAAINGALSAVLDEGERLNKESCAELLENARVEAGRLNRFVGNLLDMTRLEAGQLRPRLEPCDVQDLVGCVLTAVERRMGSTDVELQLAPDLPLVAMDLPLMVQVMTNLLENALKYAPGRPSLEIAAFCRGDDLVIEVADRGPGIAEKDLTRIFDKFYRTPVPEGVGGTGLGLSICKGIVEAHGGSIRAENRDGGGLKIIITVPLTGTAEEMA
jgi:two-component system, OmpR family, sensor histidine kinase KdpD